MTVAELQDEIVADLKIELQNEPDFSEDVLNVKVKNAIKDVRLRRNYGATTYTEEDIAEDLYQYYSVITDVARYDYNKIGSEGESSHNENSISRSYVDRESLMGCVCAFVKVL